MTSETDLRENVAAKRAKLRCGVFRGRYHWLVHGVNASGLPIFRLTVLIRGTNPAFSVAIERGTQGPGGSSRIRKLSNAVEYVLTQRHVFDTDPDDLFLEIVFIDTSGVRWHRDHNGLLHEVSADFDFVDADERLVDRDIPIVDENAHYGRLPAAARLRQMLRRST